MRKICKVVLNDQPFLANCGDLLLDWALMNGVDLPHDCRSGICGSCRVRLVEGKVFGGQDDGDDMIHACQARIVSDIEIVTEAVPEPVSMSAHVADLVRLAPDVIGVDVELPRPLRHLPGQYCKVQFRGFPARSYSPTYPLEGRPDDRLAFSCPNAFRRNGILCDGPEHPRRAPRKTDGSVWQRLSKAKSFWPHGACLQWHRICADVVDRGCSDHGTAAARTHLCGRDAKASIILHACRPVPTGTVSQRHDCSNRIGAAECVTSLS